MAAAMSRLFANDRIHVGTYGRPSRPYPLRIMRIEEPAQFVKCALATLPRELLIESVASELSDDEIDAQIVWIREQLARSQDPPLMLESKVADNVKVDRQRKAAGGVGRT
jgi:hypothetical protein